MSLNHKYLFCCQIRKGIQLSFSCLFLRGRNENEKGQKGRLEGRDEQRVLDKQLIWQIKHLDWYGADCKTENAEMKMIKEPSYTLNSCITQYDIRKIRFIESQGQMALTDEYCTSL